MERCDICQEKVSKLYPIEDEYDGMMCIDCKEDKIVHGCLICDTPISYTTSALFDGLCTRCVLGDD